jgi:hypothetical protein
LIGSQPFNHGYIWQNTTDNLIIANSSISEFNTFIGSSTQQATSVVTETNQGCYEQGGTGCYSVYGFQVRGIQPGVDSFPMLTLPTQYKPGFDNAYISWISNNQLSWTLNAAGMGADQTVQISARPIPQEPMVCSTVV